jgi:predicted dinucleotide-binding enzyme
MKIAVVGKGSVGGGLARLLAAAGHDVDAFGRGGGNASGADVIIVAVPSSEIAPALERVQGLGGQVSIDTTNAWGGRPVGFPSLAHLVKSLVGGPTAKAFNINFAKLYDRAGEQRVRPSNLYAADPDADDIVAGLIRDTGYDPVSVGDLSMAAALEHHAALARGIADAALGPYFYRIAIPGEL